MSTTNLEGQTTKRVELHVEAVEAYANAVTKTVKKLDKTLWDDDSGLGAMLLKPWTALLGATIEALKGEPENPPPSP